MKLSAKVDYACRAVLELALRYNGTAPVQLSAIAREQKMPPNFLLQLLIRLKNAGVVKSARGVSGGYYLAKPPKEIRLSDVIRAVDDSVLEEFSIINGRSGQGFDPFAAVWADMSRGIISCLDRVTFEELATQARPFEASYAI